MHSNTIISSLRTELIAGTRTRCTSNWAARGRFKISDPFSRLYWVRSGSGVVTYDAGSIHLKPGKLIVIPAYKAARYFCAKKMDLYWIHFRAQLFGCLEIFNLLNWDLSIPVQKEKDQPSCFGQFFAAIKSESLEDHLNADALLRQVLALFASREENYQEKRLQELQRFMPAIAFIEQNLHHPISLKDLTKVVPLQYAYFCDLFSKTMGQSPIDFINKKRIERAQFLISQQKRPLKEIASEVGFKDVYYFSRVFKKIIGIAPGHYREQEGLRS
jgi:AraC-like DNA-binding protein